ncbi:MAG: hypothetical protein ACPLUL_00475 [Thermanaerothrix sp.]|uniref:hypothetical protein n=1 Tax=Thermanaerothrix sp. TaxID=2972675 RepID=UPI003C7DD382
MPPITIVVSVGVGVGVSVGVDEGVIDAVGVGVSDSVGTGEKDGVRVAVGMTTVKVAVGGMGVLLGNVTSG